MNPPRWRFQSRWLQDRTFVEFVGIHIDLYFSMNTNETSPTVRWEAFKAYIRGMIISYSSSQNKAFKSKLNSLERCIKDLEDRIVTQDSPELQAKLLVLRTRYSELSSNQTAASLLRLKQSYYDQGEKAGKILAWHIKKLQSERAINSIKTNGKLTNDQAEINSAFKMFYEKLYTSEHEDSGQQEHFLSSLVFPTISTDSKGKLDHIIGTDELSEAITSMSGGKAAGPDGLPIEIYKRFKDKLR